jgi:hypothetical protein
MNFTIDKTTIVKKLIKISLYILLYILLVISLMPIIAWWAGAIGLIYLIYEISRFIMPDKPSPRAIFAAAKSFSEKSSGRLTFYIILFGILIHSACRIHSEILIQKLYNEGITEKNIITGTIPNE